MEGKQFAEFLSKYSVTKSINLLLYVFCGGGGGVIKEETEHSVAQIVIIKHDNQCQYTSM